MSGGRGDGRVAYADQAAELRRAFDRTFAQPPVLVTGGSTGFLRIRVGGDPYAMAVTAFAGLFAGKSVVPLPGVAPSCLGIAGLRGAIVPVYSLRALLGYPVERACPRWLVVARSSEAVGLAFEQFDGHLEARPSDVSPAPQADSYVVATLQSTLGTSAVLDLPSILETLGHGRRRSGDASKER